jgi:SAM-dependent methyltransferase
MSNTREDLLKRFPAAKISAYIVDDFIKGRKISFGQVIGTASGSTHSRTQSEVESVTYIENVLADYKRKGGIEKFSGIVAELGPGDSAGVAMLLRGEGCTQVDLIDRYYSDRNLEQQDKIYQLLANKYNLNHLKTTDIWDEKAIEGISWKIGEAAEDYFANCAQTGDKSYDYIVSCAVLEHLYDPLDCIVQMVKCLKPGGQMFHFIDFRDHEMFTPVKHELYYLQIPTSAYVLATKNAGRPNRILTHRYRGILESLKQQGLIDYSIIVQSLVDVGKIDDPHEFADIDPDKTKQAIDFVDQHRHKFASEFADVDACDLAVSGIFLKVIKK